MRKKLIVFILIVVFAVTVYFEFYGSSNKIKNKFSNIISRPISEKMASNKASRSFQASSSCEELFSKGVVEVLNDLEKNDTRELNCIVTALPQFDFGPLKSYCSLRPDGKILDPNMCGVLMMTYRAVLFDKATISNKDYQGMSLEFLLNKILGRILQGEDTWKLPGNDLLKMGWAVKELEPNNPDSYKVLSFIESILGHYDSVLNLSEEGLMIDPHDRDLKDVRFFAITRSDGFDPEAFTRSYANDDQALYWLAAYHRKSGNLRESKSILEKLNQDFPDDRRYKKTLEQFLASKSLKDHIFELTVPIMTITWQ